ncbi:hypothetical protein PBCVMA1D_339L [Paramecium bursaria Chlorella virus MA1D]|nr:hypothetical protein PBCVMA1D_339L [Paramecium bursaria Chlorella virus MA1D]
MYYATLNEAFGVDSLENDREETPKMTPKTKPVIRTKFTDKIFGEDVDDSDFVDTEPPPVFVSNERKLSNAEVKKYISNLYKKEGLDAVWNLLDKRVQMKLMTMCSNIVKKTKTFFDDLFTSPEKIMVILGILFFVIILLDSNKEKHYHPQSQPQVYYQPQPQPQQFYAPMVAQNPIPLQ